MFEKKVVKRTFGHKNKEVTGHWRKVHNEKLRNLHPSPNIIRVIKSREYETNGACGIHGRDEKFI